MASRSLASMHKGESAELNAILASWESHYRRRALSRALPRTLMAALVISLVLGIAAYARFRWSAGDLALMSVAVCGIGTAVNLGYVWLFPRPRSARARYFDLEFGLKERVSTALELLEGRIQARPEIESAQIADALAQARRVDARSRIGLDFRRREWAALLVSLAAVALMIVAPLVVGPEPISDGASPAVEAAQEDLREMIEAIAADTDLEEIDRGALLNALEIALERLQAEDISDEEAFAAMSQLEAQIEDIENGLQDLLDLDQSSLAAAMDALEDYGPLADGQERADVLESAQESARRDADELAQALNQLGQAAQDMSPEEARAAAEALQQAAQEMAPANPELSEQLQEMAAALESSDSQGLQEQLNQAQEELRQAQQARQEMQNAQQLLQAQAEQAEGAADEIARQQTNPQQGEAAASDRGQQQGGQPSDEQADAARPSDSQGNRPASQNMPGASENVTSEQDSDTAGSGAGEGRPSNTSLPGSGGEDQGARTDNETTGIGEINYAAIYSPTGIEGGGGDDIRLETDASDQTVGEGDFDDNPLGESRVSYDTVFSDYQNAANRALESAYVPLGLRDVVRDYFTSLEP